MWRAMVVMLAAWVGQPLDSRHGTWVPWAHARHGLCREASTPGEAPDVRTACH
jgi:hypothetical protein